MFEPKMLYTRISPPVVSVDIEKRSNLAARNAATHVAHVVAPPQFARSSIAIEIEKPQFSRHYFECLKTWRSYRRPKLRRTARRRHSIIIRIQAMPFSPSKTSTAMAVPAVSLLPALHVCVTLGRCCYQSKHTFTSSEVMTAKPINECWNKLWTEIIKWFNSVTIFARHKLCHKQIFGRYKSVTVLC